MVTTTDRDFLDRLTLARHYAYLVRDSLPSPDAQVIAGEMGPHVFDDPGASLIAKLHWAIMPADPNDPTSAYPDDVNAGLRAFDAAPFEERQKILNGWAPIEHDRARGVDVLAALAASAPIARVLVLSGDGSADLMPLDVRQDWMPLDSGDAVRLIVREGVPFDDVREALHAISIELSRRWDDLVSEVPTGVYRRRRGQVWRAFDWSGGQDGFLVTAENDVNRPIAYVCSSGVSDLGTADAEDIACCIAECPSATFDRRALDLRSYGQEDSTAPMPGFVYGLELEPLGRDLERNEERLTPRPYCKFLARAMAQQGANLSAADAVNVYEPARKNGSSPIRPVTPQPASKTGEQKSDATAAV